MSGALQAVFQNQRSFGAPPGQDAYVTAGTYSWVAPSGVTSVSVVAVGSGNGGFTAGALSYKNNITVVPGNSYSVVVSNSDSTRSSFNGNGVVSAGAGTTRTGDGGGNGGSASAAATAGAVNRGGGGGGRLANYNGSNSGAAGGSGYCRVTYWS